MAKSRDQEIVDHVSSTAAMTRSEVSVKLTDPANSKKLALPGNCRIHVEADGTAYVVGKPA